MIDSKGRAPIIVGTDASDDSRRAVAYGVGMAKKLDTDLLLIHAVDDALMAGSWGVIYEPEIFEKAGYEACEEARKYAIELGISAERVKTDVLLGSPGSVLVKLSEKARVIVLGRRTMSGIERMFVGSTSVSVVAGAQCPVVVISAVSTPEPTGKFKTIGVGLNATPDSMSTVTRGFREALILGTKLKIIHVVQPPMGLFSNKHATGNFDRQIDFSRGGIQAMIAPLSEEYPQVEVELQVVADTPLNELVTQSASLDLLIIGVPKSSWKGGYSLGGLVRGLMTHAKCPLFLTK